MEKLLVPIVLLTLCFCSSSMCLWSFGEKVPVAGEIYTQYKTFTLSTCSSSLIISIACIALLGFMTFSPMGRAASMTSMVRRR